MNGLYESLVASTAITQKQIALTRPVAVDGVTLFRSVLYLVVPLDAICERISLAPTASLTVQFSPLDVTLRHDSEGWNQSPWEYDEEQVRVDLALPIRVHRIDSGGYGKAALHRMDGDNIIETPTLTVTTHRAIEGDFTASRFMVALSSPGKPPSVSVQAAIKKSTGMKGLASSQSEKKQVAAMQKPGANPVHGVDQSEWEALLEALYGYALNGIAVQGKPTSPRLTLMNPDQTETLWQWLEFPGEQTVTRSVTVTAEQWQPALDRAFAARGEGDQELVLPLIIESDAPCHVQVHATHFQCKRQASLLAGDVTLRFSEQRQETLTLPLQLPEVGAEELQLGFSVTKGGGAVPTGPLPALESLAKTGFRLQTGDHMATSLTLAAGTFLRGYALPWWPLEEKANLSLALYADESGVPAKQPLVSTRQVVEGEAPQWLMFNWPEQVVPAGVYWLQMSVEDGSGLWLAAPGNARLHRHCLHVLPEVITVAQTPMHYALQDAGAQGTSPGATLYLNGTAVALTRQGESWVTRLQTLPAKPWTLALKMEQGGLVTVTQDILWY